MKKGYEVHLLTFFVSDREKIEKLGIKTHAISFKRGSLNILNESLVFFRIVYFLIKIKPNIVHLVTIKPVLIGGLASKLINTPGIVASISGLGFTFISKNLKIRFVKRIISFLYRFIYGSSENIKIIFQNKVDQEVIHKITRLKKRQMKLIPGSGVDLNQYKLFTFPEGKPIILFAARLLKSKGIIDFIEAAKYVSNARFVVIGKYDFENRDAISSEVIQEAVQNKYIEYWGYREDVVDIIRKSHIVVLPSYYGEGLPKILIEAAACGRPVITTDHPGCRDAIKNDISGVLVPINSPVLISKEIKKLLKNPKQMKQMSKNARTFAEENFDIRSVVESHLEIYRELLKNT